MYWKIRVFVKASGIDVIRKWVKDLSKGVQTEINTRLRYLQNEEKWSRPAFDKMQGSIHEIRIKYKKVQYRLLGFYGPEQKEFTLLVGAIEKDWKLKPKDAIDIAEKRRNLILEDKTYVRDYFKL